MILFMAALLLDIVHLQSAGDVQKIPFQDDFKNTKHGDIGFINIYFVDLNKIKISINNRALWKNYKDYMFYAVSDGGKDTLLWISKENSCLMNTLTIDVTDDDPQIDLEFPFEKDEKENGSYLSFYTTKRVVFTKDVNLINSDSEIYLDIPKSFREEFLESEPSVKNYHCVKMIKIPLTDFSSCDKIEGKIYATSNVLLSFEGVIVSNEQDRRIIQNDLWFKFFGKSNSGRDIEDFGTTNHHTQVYFDKGGMTQKVFLPRGLSLAGMDKISIVNGIKTICEIKISDDFKKTSAENLDGISIVNPGLRKDKIGSECETITKPFEGSFTLSSDYKSGSTAVFACNSGTVLVPENFISTCTFTGTDHKWMPDISTVKCEPVMTSCERNLCRNEGNCVEKDAKVSCECQPGYKGPRCEMGVCFDNKCINGDCMEYPGEKEGYICQCEGNASGKYCDKIPHPEHLCGRGGTDVRILKAGFQCKCAKGFISAINSKCIAKSSSEALGCVLPEIPHGDYEGKSYFYLKIGESKKLRCLPGYEKTVEEIKCIGIGKYSVSLKSVCRKAKKEPGTESHHMKEPVKSSRGNFYLIGIFLAIFVTILSLFLLKCYCKRDYQNLSDA